MATGTRIRTDLQSGTLGASLTDVETGITFAVAPDFPTLSAGQYIPLTLDTEEIVHLTAYTAAATTGTIERGQEGTTAVAHTSGDAWLHGATAQDFNAAELTDIKALSTGVLYKGSNGLTVASGDAPSGMNLIETVTLGADGVIEFTDIPQTYESLLLIGKLLSDRSDSDNDNLCAQLGGVSLDTGANYDAHFTTQGQNGPGAVVHNVNATSLKVASIPGSQVNTLSFGSVQISLVDYQNTTHRQHVHVTAAYYAGTDYRDTAGGGRWDATGTAVERVKIFPDNGTDFKAGSTVALYGVGGSVVTEPDIATIIALGG